jgi:histidine triad (HIT) family protein
MTCPFCAIAVGAQPARMVHEWHDTIAFEPLVPVTDGHVLVVPRAHVADFRADPEVSATTMARAASIAATMGDVNVISSAGAAATQTVDHLHLHLVPRHLGDGLKLPWTR